MVKIKGWIGRSVKLKDLFCWVGFDNQLSFNGNIYQSHAPDFYEREVEVVVRYVVRKKNNQL